VAICPAFTSDEEIRLMAESSKTSLRAKAPALIANIEQVIIGKTEVVTRAVAALLAQGHILLEDLPGVGKTVLAKTIAFSIEGEFKRIQFTADLLPSDITGVNIFRQDAGEFVFRAGPLFTHVLLGDEINRATPRTQSSLLEAMEEQQATVDGVRHLLAKPFFVIATQNPIELEGTYPLPFAQMDRFMVRLRLGYMNATDEQRMLRERTLRQPLADLKPALTAADLVSMQQEVRQVRVTDDLLAYIVAVVRATREADNLEYGASPRASLDLLHYSQAMAYVAQRDYLMPDDVKKSAPAVLAHRVIVKKGTRNATLNLESLIDELIQTIPVPI
jgi:MoxR-like ATPase